MTYVRTIPHEEAIGALKEVYDYMIESRGFIPNVQAVSSIRPRIMQAQADHIGFVMRSKSGFTPAERGIIAAVVFAVNKCQY